MSRGRGATLGRHWGIALWHCLCCITHEFVLRLHCQDFKTEQHHKKKNKRKKNHLEDIFQYMSRQYLVQ